MEDWWSVLMFLMDLILLAFLQIAFGLHDNMSFEVVSLQGT